MYSSERPRQSDPGVCGGTHSSECWGLRASLSFPRLPLPTLFIFALAPIFARSKHRNFSSTLHGNACYADYAYWDCNDFNIGKTKRRLHDRKAKHFKALINGYHVSALADHVTLRRQLTLNQCNQIKTDNLFSNWPKIIKLGRCMQCQQQY